MLTNWEDQSQKLGIPNRKNELWRFSQVKDFLDTESLPTDQTISTPQLPTALQGDKIFYNGHDWASDSSHIKFSKNLSVSSDELSAAKEISDNDGMYAWYRKHIPTYRVEIAGSTKIIICIPHSEQQLLIPELTLDLNLVQDDITIYEVQTAKETQNAATIYSIKICHHNKNLTFHRLNLNPHAKSISWLHIQNAAQVKAYIWKQKNSQNKEFIHINNIKNGADSRLSLVANLGEDAKYDLTTHVNHTVGQTSSNQLFKCILDDNAQAALTGKIFIDKNCPGTEAFFKSKQTLLSSKAHIYSQPQLEIHTDDVKCAHGSSTGSLQEEELFYLMSRGISPAKAKKMLLGAFINDEILNLKNEEEQKFFQGLIL